MDISEVYKLVTEAKKAGKWSIQFPIPVDKVKLLNQLTKYNFIVVNLGKNYLVTWMGSPEWFKSIKGGSYQRVPVMTELIPKLIDEINPNTLELNFINPKLKMRLAMSLEGNYDCVNQQESWNKLFPIVSKIR